jgi:MFS family permease
MTEIPNQRWLRIIPLSLGMYTIALINRTNVSLALPAMSRDLHIDPLQVGNIAGVFFWGYLLLQIPGGDLAERWSAKRYVAMVLAIWGFMAFGCGLAQNLRQMLIMRFVLGVAEGGMYPATVILLSHWFPRRERARANGLLSLALPFALIVSSPLSGWLMDLWNWRIMLMVEGALPLLWLPIWLIGISDHPREAKWISSAERECIERGLQHDAEKHKVASHENYLSALFHPQVLLLTLIKFLALTGQLGYLFWLPSALGKAKTLSNLRVGLLVTLPFIVGAISMVLISWHSDKWNERRGHVSFALGIGGGSLLAGALASKQSPILSFCLLCIAAVGIFGQMGPFWALTTEKFSKRMVGPVTGLVNGVGQLGGYVGPLLVGYLNKRTGSFVYGFGTLAVAMVFGSLLMLFVTDAEG